MTSQIEMAGFVGPPNAWSTPYAAKAPTMNTSPWAKLSSLRMPYTIEYPSAIKA